MPHTIHTRRPTRSRRRWLAVAALLSGVLLAGCGGSSPSPAGATVGGASGTTVGGAAGGGSTSAASTGPSTGPPEALAFAKCMRANGVSNFPDPTAGGGFEFQTGAGIVSSPAFKVAQAKCRKLLAGGGPPGPGTKSHPSAQTLAKLVKIAECMRQHGVPQFPDPTTSVPSNPSGVREITDFDGAILLFPATINLQAPAYRQALTACGAPPLGLRH
jgi:hypothetical protein